MPAKLSARARVFATGRGRKTDAVDALLVDRRDELGRARTEVISHR